MFILNISNLVINEIGNVRIKYIKFSHKCDQKCTYNLTLRRFRVTIVTTQKQEVLFIYSECVSVALNIHHAMRMRHNVICDLSSSTITFSSVSHKKHDFPGGGRGMRGGGLKIKNVCFDFPTTLV